MTTKAVMAATFVCAACLYVFSSLVPSDPYFYLVSSNIAIVIARLAISLALLNLAFRRKQVFRYQLSRPVCQGLALLLTVMGLAGLLILPLDFALANTIMPFDYIFAAGSGLFMGYLSLSFKPGKAALPQFYPKNLHLRVPARLVRTT